MRGVSWGAAVLAVGLGFAGASSARSSFLPGAVSVVVTANGVRGEDVTGEETAADCARFRLRPRDVRQFFRRARVVDGRAYFHDLDMSRCRAEGTLRLADGRRGTWRIDRERRGMVVLPGEEPVLLHCRRCTAAAFEPFSGPEEEGR